ncbi:hypothetical protein ACVWZR_002424 [Bradyrhizobium sp. i1.3.1]
MAPDAEDPHCQAVWEENRARFFGRPARPVPQQAARATPSTTNAAEGDNDEQSRRHRHLPQHLHLLYIDSGFGLIQGEITSLALVVIDISLAGLFWATCGVDEGILRGW